MKSYALTQVPNHVLLRDLDSLVAKDRLNTADLLAHLGEVEARRLYAPASCSSMHVYCVRVLRLSEDAAGKRLTASRAARRFPALFHAVADGRLHLSAVVLLAPHLDRRNHEELVAAASHRTKREIEELVAARFPRPDVETVVRPIELGHAWIPPAEVGSRAELSAPGRIEKANEVANLAAAAEVEGAATAGALVPPAPPASAPTPSCAPAPPDRARLAPLSAERFALQVTISRTTRDKIRRAQDLLGHSIRPGDVAEVIDRALDLLVARLEARKCGLTNRPRTETPRPAKNARYVSRADRRFIEQRDDGQCTYVGPDDRRCEERFALQLHHDEAFARGGPTTRDNLFLRCPTHNQLAAEHEFGADHVHRKREERRARVARERAEKLAREARRAREVASASWPADSEASASRARTAAEAAAAKARRDLDAMFAAPPEPECGPSASAPREPA